MPRWSSASVGLLIGSTCCALACGGGGAGASNPRAGASGAGAANAGTTGIALGGHESSGGSTGEAGTSALAGTAGTGTSALDGCQAALICDDFESYADKPTTPWAINVNQGAVVIDTAKHNSGTKSVKLTTTGAAAYQQAFISLVKPFPIANNAFYGRMMIYATKAANDGVHWTMIQGEGAVTTPAIDRAVVRYGGQHQQTLMANYDSGSLKSDCWQHSQTKMPEGQWACMEWYFEGATNTQKFWLDGKAIDDLTVVGQGQGCLDHDTQDMWLFPTFKRVSVGWESYQTDDPREVWIDDVAISTTRIGCPQ